jgi:glycosyltransferase involved in cell wall biosynthesis
MKISVIIPAFNEEANIGKSLQALEAQTLSKELFEIIVVDNGSTDGTMSAADRFKTRLPLQVVSKPEGKISAVRNYGAALAAGEILAFLDADCIPPSTWLEESRALAREDLIWGAHYLVPLDATWVGKIWFAYQATEQKGEVSFIPGSNFFIYRSTFDMIGGFGESLETSEDVEISHRAKSRGIRVIAYPALAVYHEGTPRTLRQFYRQNRWHGKHVLRIFIANLPSTKNLHLVAMSFYILAMFWAAMIVPIVALPKHHYLLSITPLALLLLPAIALSLRKAVVVHRLQAGPPLCVLYMTYFLSRAAALTHISVRSHR